jgi:putative hydrolase of the HAD superfamily
MRSERPPFAAIEAVLFDLDDTLYPQASWLEGAWHAVALRAAADGVDPTALEAELHAIAARGSDQGRIIDQALASLGAERVDVAPLLRAFRGHQPTRLEPYPGVDDALGRLGARVPLGIVSDGDPEIQRAKLDAVGLGARFAVVVLSDEHGREHRKPAALPFERALAALGVEPAASVYVGDRPEKDVAGAAAAGMRSIRVRTGEWRARPDDVRAFACLDTVVEAIDLLLAEIDQGESAPTSSRKSSRPGTSR